MNLPWPVLVGLVLTVLVGALVQRMVGLGLGLVGAPVVTLIAPELMPGMLLVLGGVLSMIILMGDREQIDWRGLAWIVPARLPGTWLGVVLLGALSQAMLGVAVAAMVLGAVALTARAPRISKTPATLLLAGLVSGAAATTSSIGGPPIALVYQSQPAREIRTTLATLFVVGTAISLAGLLWAGQLTAQPVVLALAMVPVLLAGAALGARLERLVDGTRMRYAVLGVCAASALVLLVRSV